MKSQSGIKTFFEKIGTLVLLIVLLFACTTSPETPRSPLVKPTKTKTSPISNSPENDPPTKTFSLQNANKIAPDDVLKEVSFGGRGAGECTEQDYSTPGFESNHYSPNPDMVDWLDSIHILSCGWQDGEQVDITITTPDNKDITQIQQAKPSGLSHNISLVYVDYQTTIDSPDGVYTFTFRGNSSQLKKEVTVSRDNGPRMYYIGSLQSFYLYGFAPNEHIRLFLYRSADNYTLAAWQSYTVNAYGALLIKVGSEVDPSRDLSIVLGDVSGQVGFNDVSILSHEDSGTLCPNSLTSRLKVGKYAYVATDPPLNQRVREGAGTNYSIIGSIAPGNPMKILDGPKCADGWAWWKVQSIKKADLVGWTSEGDDVYWLIPCDSLNSCP